MSTLLGLLFLWVVGKIILAPVADFLSARFNSYRWRNTYVPPVRRSGTP